MIKVTKPTKKQLAANANKMKAGAEKLKELLKSNTKDLK